MSEDDAPGGPSRGWSLVLLPIGVAIAVGIADTSFATGLVAGVGTALVIAVLVGIGFSWSRRVAKTKHPDEAFVGDAGFDVDELAKLVAIDATTARRAKRWASGQVSGTLSISGGTWRWAPQGVSATWLHAPNVVVHADDVRLVSVVHGALGLGAWVTVHLQDGTGVRFKTNASRRLVSALPATGAPPVEES